MTAPTISASAIESFDPALGGCARKWAFSRLDGVPKPQSPGAALGSRCHELWESYLRDGVPFDLSTVEGRICQATQHQLPAPFSQTGAPGVVEHAFKFGWENVAWAGKKDLVFVDENGTLVVLDHKTTSDFRYAKTTREALLGHPQAPIYAVGSCEHGGVGAVGLAWNYVKHGVTFDKDAQPGPYGYTIKSARRPVALEPPVRLVVSRAEAEDALGRFVPTAKRMLKIIADPPAPGEDGLIAKQLEPNPDACEAFGGCPYRAQCGLTPQEIASRLVHSFAAPPDGATAENGEQKNMGSALRDRIAAIKADRAGNGPTHTSAIGVQQAIEAERAAKAQAQNAAAVQTPATVAAQSVFGPVNPPEGSRVVGDVEPLAENFAASGQTQPLPPAEAPTQPDAPAAKRRGRPPGSKNKVKKAPVPETVDEEYCNAGPGPQPLLTATHEVLTYDPADTIPAPAIDVEEVAQRAAEIVLEKLRGAL